MTQLIEATEHEKPQKLGQSELMRLLDSGIIPQAISETGADDEPLTEILICESISGGANYEKEMPKGLTLARYMEDGTEHREKYRQEIDPSYEELRLLSEDLEAIHVWLDYQGVPRNCKKNNTYSLVGRILQYKRI